MGKSVPMTAKFTEEECDRIDAWAASHGMSRSGALHEMVMRNFTISKAAEPEPIQNDVVKFRFTDDFAYFWKDHDYVGFIKNKEAHIRFGGEWMRYDLDTLPAEIIEE